MIIPKHSCKKKNTQPNNFLLGCVQFSTGGEHRIRTCGRSHVNGFQDRRFKPLSQFSTFVLRRSENRCNGLPKQDAWFDIKFCWSLLISEK